MSHIKSFLRAFISWGLTSEELFFSGRGLIFRDLNMRGYLFMGGDLFLREIRAVLFMGDLFLRDLNAGILFIGLISKGFKFVVSYFWGTCF